MWLFGVTDRCQLPSAIDYMTIWLPTSASFSLDLFACFCINWNLLRLSLSWFQVPALSQFPFLFWISNPTRVRSFVFPSSCVPSYCWLPALSMWFTCVSLSSPFLPYLFFYCLYVPSLLAGSSCLNIQSVPACFLVNCFQFMTLCFQFFFCLSLYPFVLSPEERLTWFSEPLLTIRIRILSPGWTAFHCTEPLY